jgi:hypothetical protein
MSRIITLGLMNPRGQVNDYGVGYAVSGIPECRIIQR